MKAIGKEMKKAEADLGHLSLYDLFRRDWKAATDNGAEDVLHIGFANIPLTLAQQFKRIGNLSAWLEVEQTFAHVHGADLTLTLTKAKVKRTARDPSLLSCIDSGSRSGRSRARRSRFESSS